MHTPWRIELFGGLRAAYAERVITRFQTRKTAALLAYLAFFRDRSHPREELIELLWPESPVAAGRNRLKVALASLRHQLEPPGVPPGAVVIADRVTVQLNGAAVATDVTQFEALVDAGFRAGTSQERSQCLAGAIDLYRGELLPGYFEEWIVPQRARLAETYLQALWQLAELLREANDLSRAVSYAHRAVAADPVREEGHHHLIRLLAASGEPEAARRQYHELERLLAAELGVAPEAEIRDFARTLGRPKSIAPAPGIDPAERILTVVKHPRPAAEPHPPSGAPGRLPSGTITFLLAEITEISTRREPSRDTLVGALVDCRERLRSLFRGHGGHSIDATPETVCGAFGRASDAFAAALAGQQALASDPEASVDSHPRARMALHIGEVEPGEAAESSPALRHAGRLLSAAHPGQILLSADAAGLLRRDLEPGARLVDLGLYRLHEATAPERLYQVDAPEILPRQFPPLRAPQGEMGNLPMQFTRFFGREEEIARLQALIMPDSRRLVTLTGPGGSGKTRLALEAAGRLREPLAGAVWFVPLADHLDPQLLPEKMADTLDLPRSPGVQPLEQLAATLSRQPSLLLLDSFEHLVSRGGGWVRTLLERVGRLTVLVTSRHRLGLAGEREFPVLPLPVPVVSKAGESGLAADCCSLTTVAACPSVQLFIDRAQAVRPDFQVTKANGATVAALCARLDGLPLALQLAASRAGALTPQQMLERLEQRFELLVSRGREIDPRHRSLQAALDWSYQLLPPELQRFFARLSVFRGGWTVAAAEAVCGEEGAGRWVLVVGDVSAAPTPNTQHPTPALEYLEQLQECSLVLTEETAGEMRYRLLETLREHAAAQLRPEERAGLARRHAQYYLALAEAAEPEVVGANQAAWLDRLAAEHDNMREALRWCLRSVESGQWLVVSPTGPNLEAGPCLPALFINHYRLPTDLEMGLRLAGALGPFWEVRGHYAEGQAQLTALLALPGAEARTAARARALHAAGFMAWARHDFGAARRFHEESLTIRRELGDKPGVAASLHRLGQLAESQDNYGAARTLHEESLALWRELGDKRGIALSLDSLGDVTRCQGDDAAARSLHAESLAVQRKLGDKQGVARCLQRLGRLAYHQGDYAAARALYAESLAICRELGNKPGIALSLNSLGEVARCQRDYAGAGPLYEESLALWRELGDGWGIAGMLANLGYVAQYQADYQHAATLFAQSLTLSRELGSHHGIAIGLGGLAGVTGAAGQPERAARLFGAAEALREAIGAHLWPADRIDSERSVAAVRAALDPAVFTAAWAAGRAILPEQAIAEALGERESPAPEPVRQIPPPGPGALPEDGPRATRDDLTAEAWNRIAALLPAAAGRRGRPYQEHRRVINGILWVLRTRAQWRDLPPRYGSWHTCHDRYVRWRRAGLWDRIEQALQDPMSPRG